MIIEVPGYQTLDIRKLLLDYNGTIAVDGLIRESVKERLKELSEQFEIFVLTADTHGTARKECEGLGVKVHISRSGMRWITSFVYWKRKILYIVSASEMGAMIERCLRRHHFQSE